VTGSAHIIQGDARCLPLADDSVDLVVTSPPYFALRSYQDAGEHYAGQLGSEATPAEFVDALLEVTRECVRVLKPTGSLWVNLGDKYANPAPSGNTGKHHAGWKDRRDDYAKSGTLGAGVKQKSLIGIPWRYALRCIDDLGLILRAEVIWSKPNGLPESVQDRVRRSHEQWFHFTLQPRYFSAVDEIREPQQSVGERHNGRSGWVNATGKPGGYEVTRGFTERALNPLGKLPGSVWTVPTEPLQVPDHLGVDHFAAFPTEFPRRIIMGWSPSGVCAECGEGRRPVVAKEYEWLASRSESAISRRDAILPTQPGHEWTSRQDRTARTEATITGYICACPEPDAPTTPAVILDPFAGPGTVPLVAKALGRTGIGVELSGDYCRLAEWRTNDPDQLAKAARVEKPPRQIDGQLGFDLEGIA
jgi:DNA modification methylase